MEIIMQQEHCKKQNWSN